MTLLICHLIGDYVLQSHVMADRKTSSMAWAQLHALVYTLPFAALVWWRGDDYDSPWPVFLAISCIMYSHALIDRFKLADKWCRFYGVGHPGAWDRAVRLWSRCCWDPRCITRGVDLVPPFAPPPPFLGVWLTIIVDNTMHLCINAACFAAWGIA